MASAKKLRPPFKWGDSKSGLIEDQQYKRWSIDIVRSMRNGTYDWKNHEEKRV